MKKALLFGLSLSLALSLTACGGSNDNAADSTQDTSTPEVTQSVDTSTPEVEQTAQTTTEETTAEETPAPAETTEQSTPEVQLFTDCNETVYAATTVNVRDTYSTSGNKVGSLTTSQSVTRTGTGQGEAAGWSRIEFNGQVAYVNSDYLSTTKPSTSSSSGSSSGSTSTTKPSTSTGSSSSSGGSSSSGSSSSGNSYSKPFTPTTDGDWVTGDPTLGKDDLDQSNSNNDDSNVPGYYNPNTGEFYYGNP